jgi:hypothetical protein
MHERALALCAVAMLAGCGLAGGYFNGSRMGSGGSGYGSATLGPGSNQRVGGAVFGNSGYGLGTMPGYGHTSITRNGGTVEITDVNLVVYGEMDFHFSPSFVIGIDGAIVLDTLEEPNNGPEGGMKEVDYLGFASALKWIVPLGEDRQVWIGGGVHVGGVGGTSGLGPRVVAGAQTQIGWLGPFRMLLRVEASATRGANDFAQEWVNGGFVLNF